MLCVTNKIIKTHQTDQDQVSKYDRQCFFPVDICILATGRRLSALALTLEIGMTYGRRAPAGSGCDAATSICG